MNSMIFQFFTKFHQILVKLEDFCKIWWISWIFGDFGEIPHFSWIRGPKSSKYCNDYVCFPPMAPRNRLFSEILVFKLKSWYFTKNNIFSWKSINFTKFQETTIKKTSSRKERNTYINVVNSYAFWGGNPEYIVNSVIFHILQNFTKISWKFIIFVKFSRFHRFWWF